MEFDKGNGFKSNIIIIKFLVTQQNPWTTDFPSFRENMRNTFGLLLTLKEGRGLIEMVSKIICLIEISSFADNHTAKFSMVIEIFSENMQKVLPLAS